MEDATIKIAKFEKIETPKAVIFFTVQKNPESRAFLLQTYVELAGNEHCSDEQLCDIAWVQVKENAMKYLQEDDTKMPITNHPLTNSLYSPKV